MRFTPFFKTPKEKFKLTDLKYMSTDVEATTAPPGMSIHLTDV
jgi:hypothetical protein